MPLAAKVPRPGCIELEEVPQRRPQAGEVSLRVSHCGVCGSDLHFFHGRLPPPAVCPGHEISAVVEAVGGGAGSVREGDHVAVEPLARCGRCACCRRGDYHLCEHLAIFGIHAAGGMAEQMVVPAYCLYPLPASVDLELGALTEPLAVAVHAARLAGVGPDTSVLILGAGTIGLLSVAACKHLQARFVTITARYPQQRGHAAALGADQVLEPEQVAQCEATPEVVIETVGGGADTVADGVAVVARGGRVVVTGLFDQAPGFNPLLLILKEVTITGSNVYNLRGGRHDFDIALEILSEQGALIAPLITHRFSLNDTQPAFETAADKASGAVKVLIVPGAGGSVPPDRPASAGVR